jgi:hypothetical protein
MRPSNPIFSQLYPQNRRKVHTSRVVTGMISHQEAPRDDRVSAPIHKSRLCRQTLEPACSFPKKGWVTDVSTLTTPNTVSTMEYKHVHVQTNTKWHIGDKHRRYMHNHHQVHYEQDRLWSCRYRGLE